MATIETQLGLIDAKFLDLRITPIDDEKRYGSRIEVWPKPIGELVKLEWELGEEAHPNCGRGDAQSAAFLQDTVDPLTHAMGPGTLVVTRGEFHPPNCVVAKLARWHGAAPIAIYEHVSWQKGNPFEETPAETEVDYGDGRGIVMAPTAGLTKKVSLVDNETEYTHVVEYRDESGKVVKRGVDVKLRHPGVSATGSAASFC